MQYLITFNDDRKPFLTKWLDYENHYVEGMTIFNLWVNTYSTDGKIFLDIPEDHL